MQQISCITRDHPRVSRENFLQLAQKFLHDPSEFHASLETLLHGKMKYSRSTAEN